MLLLFTVHYSPFTISAHEGEHSAEKKTTAAPTVSIVTAERNIQGETGNFNFVLRRVPSDPRAGETGQFLASIAETVEGGFGAGAPVPLASATVKASITKTDGGAAAENLPVAPEENGNYRISYKFGNAGDYKIVIAVTTADNRSFLALQGQQAEQRANANQAKTRLAQAQRELRRSENLVEVGAVPKRRVEEANTAVRVAEQEVTAAERQVVLLENQIKQAQAGQAIFNAPTVRQPTRSFPYDFSGCRSHQRNQSDERTASRNRNGIRENPPPKIWKCRE